MFFSIILIFFQQVLKEQVAELQDLLKRSGVTIDRQRGQISRLEKDNSDNEKKLEEMKEKLERALAQNVNWSSVLTSLSTSLLSSQQEMQNGQDCEFKK